ncbi:hypothetical protein GCM10010924_38300 [Rhizobium wenxiniae]|uniref:NADPH-dependent FMN reductase-like domain-containing protein n=1 Tax=Rhizobium wenxiniae TaxID=1737357 RepID=A0A7X0D1S7_9HYPH|nr:hypothetical protein [Rhizobium wenxiniae]GGG05985.1 hypothetical protein GCM10010924_38300 [Rhizobium wenxiniae]
MSLKALAFNSTLKRSGGEPSSTDRMLELIAAEMAKSGVETETIRLADHNILPGVTSDEGPGDDWPAVRKKLLAADILILGTLHGAARQHLASSNAWTPSSKRPTTKGGWLSYGAVPQGAASSWTM